MFLKKPESRTIPVRKVAVEMLVGQRKRMGQGKSLSRWRGIVLNSGRRTGAEGGGAEKAQPFGQGRTKGSQACLAKGCPVGAAEGLLGCSS